MKLKVLVTGGTGFLGNRVCAAMRDVGWTAVPISRRTGYDLRNESEALSAVVVTRPDVIVHLAATVGGIGANMERPGAFFRENMLMGMNVIHAASLARARLVTAGTVCSFPKHCPVPFKEEDFWNGFPEETNSPYGIAKKSLLVMCQAYARQHGLEHTYLVLSNLYGPEDNFDERGSHVIPALIKRFVEAKRDGLDVVTCWGTGVATRSFLHVDDAAAGIVQACKMDPYGDNPINLSGSAEISMKDLSGLIAKAVGFRGRIEWDASKPDGQPRRAMDGTRAAELLNWTPKRPFDEGVKETVAWFVEKVEKPNVGTQPS